MYMIQMRENVCYQTLQRYIIQVDADGRSCSVWYYKYDHRNMGEFVFSTTGEFVSSDTTHADHTSRRRREKFGCLILQIWMIRIWMIRTDLWLSDIRSIHIRIIHICSIRQPKFSRRRLLVWSVCVIFDDTNSPVVDNTNSPIFVWSYL